MIGACQSLDSTEGSERFIDPPSQARAIDAAIGERPSSTPSSAGIAWLKQLLAPSLSMSAPDRLPLKRPRDFGVVAMYLVTQDQFVRMSEHFAVNEEGRRHG